MAKVFITDAPDSVAFKEDEETKLVNPELSFVANIPPELWTQNAEGLVVPLFDEQEITKRLSDLGVKSFANHTDTKIKDNLSKLVEIPDALDSVVQNLISAESNLIEYIADSVHSINEEILHTKNQLIERSNYQSGVFSQSMEELSAYQKQQNHIYYKFRVAICIQLLLIIIMQGVLIYLSHR